MWIVILWDLLILGWLAIWTGMMMMVVVRTWMGQIRAKHSPLHLCLITSAAATTALMCAASALVLPMVTLVLAVMALVMVIHVIVAHVTHVTATLEAEHWSAITTPITLAITTGR